MKIFKMSILVLTVFSILHPVMASDFTLDASIGVYGTTAGVPFMDVRLAYDLGKLCPNLSVRADYYTLDSGKLNNFRVGGQGIYSIKITPEMTFAPFVGCDLSKSDLGAKTLSTVVGFDFKMKPFFIGDLILGCQSDIYIDGYMLGYYAGLAFPIFDFLNLDLIPINGLMTNDTNRIGVGGRISLSF